MRRSDPTPAVLEAELQRLAGRRSIPHAILAVESLDGRFRWSGVAGARFPPQTPFFLASITKLYIAAAILRLAERGLLHLDEPLSGYLPAGLIRGLHRFQGHDYTSQITLRHCLSHATGLPDSLEERPRGGRSLLELAFEEDDRAWTLPEAITLARDLLKPHFPPQDLSRPSARIRYSDTNFQLLMAVIEAVTAKTLAGAYDELLFRPLGLRHTRLPETPGEAPAPVYFGSRILELPRAFESSRDLIAAPADALAFLRALIQGNAFDRPETARLMFGGPWRRFGLPRDAAALRTPSWPIEYGLGAMRFRLPRWLAPLRTPPELIGHTGSTGTWLFYCPALELLFAGAVNEAGSGAVPYRFMPRLLRALRRSGFR